MKAITHKNLELEIDRELLDDVFDDPVTRYILLYMYLVRNGVFQNLEDDDIIEGFEKVYQISDIDRLYKKNVEMLLPEEIIEEMFTYNLITNIKDFKTFEVKKDDYEIKIHNGVYLEAGNVLFSDEGLLIIIKSNFPEITMNKIKKTLNTLRGTMCQVSNVMHPLVNKFRDDFALDDNLYDIIFILGNPYLALRLEKLIVSVLEKAKEIQSKLDKYLKIFFPESLKPKFLQKVKKAGEIEKDGDQDDLLEYIIEKSRNLPSKFDPKEKSELYWEWRGILNRFLLLKNNFTWIFNEIDKVKSFYSGKNQKMSYLKFIEEVTDKEDEINSIIKNSLLEIRKLLKDASEKLESLSEKEIKILNLDLEREIIDNEDDEDSDED